MVVLWGTIVDPTIKANNRSAPQRSVLGDCTMDGKGYMRDAREWHRPFRYSNAWYTENFVYFYFWLASLRAVFGQSSFLPASRLCPSIPSEARSPNILPASTTFSLRSYSRGGEGGCSEPYAQFLPLQKENVCGYLNLVIASLSGRPFFLTQPAPKTGICARVFGSFRGASCHERSISWSTMGSAGLWLNTVEQQ